MTRIIAGVAKGRRLAVPSAGTRPTSDRAREGLFNTLASRVQLDGARVLDLYAGTGAIGLEALSRGARTAVLVESDRRAVEVIRANIEAVGLPGAEVVRAPVDRYGSDEPFDIVFADPPYEKYHTTEFASLLAHRALTDWLAPDGVLVLELPSGSTPPQGDPGLTWFAEKRYGEALLCYGRRR